MSSLTTLRDLMGLGHEPGLLADAALVMIDCQNTYREGVMQLSGVEAALLEARRVLDRARELGRPVMSASASGTAPFCTVNVTGMQVTAFEDGQLAGSGVGVSGTVAVSGGTTQPTSGTTGEGGTAPLSNVSGGCNCSGTATLTISGGGSRTVSYSN